MKVMYGDVMTCYDSFSLAHQERGDSPGWCWQPLPDGGLLAKTQALHPGTGYLGVS